LIDAELAGACPQDLWCGVRSHPSVFDQDAAKQEDHQESYEWNEVNHVRIGCVEEIRELNTYQQQRGDPEDYATFQPAPGTWRRTIADDLNVRERA
jgi:hypothetical protein